MGKMSDVDKTLVQDHENTKRGLNGVAFGIFREKHVILHHPQQSIRWIIR